LALVRGIRTRQVSKANEGFGVARTRTEACFEHAAVEEHEVRYPSLRMGAPNWVTPAAHFWARQVRRIPL